MSPQEPDESNGPSMEELVRALQRIPPSQREALVLRELEGRSYDEIAETLNLTKSALETLLFRARRSLADELENAATCDRAELGLSRQLDGRISRKERRRLLDHIAECPACARLQVTQGKQRRAFKGLALLPLPFALTFFKGAPSASAATGLPTIGAAARRDTAVVGGGTATGGGLSLGGLAVGGVALKAAAVVAAVSVAGGVGIVGAREIDQSRGPATSHPPSEARTLAATHPRRGRRTAHAGARRSAVRSAPAAGVAAAGANHGKATAKVTGRHNGATSKRIGFAPREGAAEQGARRWRSPRPLIRRTRPTPAPGSSTHASQARRQLPAREVAWTKANGKATADKPTKTPATPAIPASPEGSKTRRNAGNARNSGVIVERERRRPQRGRRPRRRRRRATARPRRLIARTRHSTRPRWPAARASLSLLERASIGRGARLPGASDRRSSGAGVWPALAGRHGS